jgi:molybdopterin-guanine dinucleotide biosynthesis protein
MTSVIIGGHSRNIGKTSIMAELVRRVRPPEWTAVKITQYGHGVCSLDGEPCSCDPGEHGFVLTEEHERKGGGDTRRFLQAGARRSLWLRVRQGQLHRALPALLRALRREDWVMIESNSILGQINPALYLFALDPSQNDFKASALKYLERADAFVQIGPPRQEHSWPGVNKDLFGSKPAFHLARPDELTDELVQFVRQRLGLGGDAHLGKG